MLPKVWLWRDFVKRLNRLSLSQRASKRLDQFMPILLERFEALALDDAIVNRVLDLVSAICRRSAYLSLLVQNPAATRSMLELFAASKRVADAVTRYPALLDELIDPSLGAHPFTLQDIQARIKRILDGGDDPEITLQDLNYFKQMTSPADCRRPLEVNHAGNRGQYLIEPACPKPRTGRFDIVTG